VLIAPCALLLCLIAGSLFSAQNQKTQNRNDQKPSQNGVQSIEQSTPDPQEKAWQVLRSGLAEKRASRRLLAVQALALLPSNQRATGFALTALKDRDRNIRAAAAVVLGQQRAQNAIPALKEALSDRDVSVNLAAAHALLLLKDPAAYGVYYAVLMGDKKTDDGLIQSQLRRVEDPKQLAQMGISEGVGFVPFGGMGYDAYRTIHQRGGSPVRANAARYLAQDPDVMAKDALIQTAVTDKNEAVRLAALDALAQREDPTCIERLTRNLSDRKLSVSFRTAAVILHLSARREK
jgi:HEAT repeat protein